MFYINFIKNSFLIITINFIYVVAQMRDIDVEKLTKPGNISSLNNSSSNNEKPKIIISAVNSPSIINIDSHPNLKLLPNISGENRCSSYKNIEPRLFLLYSGYGKRSNLGEFPFMALLQYENDAKGIIRCAGTLINENYVLTAAHCINSKLLSVRLGEHNLITEIDCDNYFCSDPVQNISIEKIVVHNYNSTTKLNDIALLRLKRAANITANNVKPICLPKTNILRNKSSGRAYIAGWGETEHGELSTILLKGEVKVNAQRLKCENNYKRIFKIDITNEYICAFGIEKFDTCRGDSGGPLFDITENYNYVQYGIVSAGLSVICGTQYDIGGALYVNVSQYIKWILDHLES